MYKQTASRLLQILKEDTLSNMTFAKLAAGNNITYMSKNHWNGEMEEVSATVREVSENLIKLSNSDELYKFKNRWYNGHYARNAVKLVSVE